MKFTVNQILKDTKKLDSKYLKPASQGGSYEFIENSDIVMVTDMTSNSVQLLHLPRTKSGVRAYQWYSVYPDKCLRDFENRFKKITKS